MISTIITAFISFASTNLDDIFILMILFSQARTINEKKYITLGQYLGIGTLTIISIIGALGVSIFPDKYISLLGLLPIYLGIKAYFDYKKGTENSLDNEAATEATEINLEEKSPLNFFNKFINPQVLTVFTITLANGGDNIAIYIPLFSSLPFIGILVTTLIFMLLVGLWCFIAIKFSKHSFVQGTIERYQHIFVPIVFIGLGVFILL